MRIRIAAAILLFAVTSIAQGAFAQDSKTPPASLKDVLLQELRETHSEKNWFVSEKEAAGGLTGEQAAWSDGKNHSVGQLVQHLNYWNARILNNLKGEKQAKATDDNTETFNFKAQDWEATQKQYEQVMAGIEAFVQSADETTIAKIAPTIARVGQHNAYHIGEMVTSRKKQGSWNPETGVK